MPPPRLLVPPVAFARFAQQRDGRVRSGGVEPELGMPLEVDATSALDGGVVGDVAGTRTRTDTRHSALQVETAAGSRDGVARDEMVRCRGRVELCVIEVEATAGTGAVGSDERAGSQLQHGTLRTFAGDVHAAATRRRVARDDGLRDLESAVSGVVDAAAAGVGLIRTDGAAVDPDGAVAFQSQSALAAVTRDLRLGDVDVARAVVVGEATPLVSPELRAFEHHGARPGEVRAPSRAQPVVVEDVRFVDRRAGGALDEDAAALVARDRAACLDAKRAAAREVDARDAP